MDLPPDAVRLIGTAGGAIAGLALSSEPYRISGYSKRLVVSFVFGWFLSDPFGEEVMGWTMTIPNRISAAACLASMFGWWAAHGAIRAIQIWSKRAE